MFVSPSLTKVVTLNPFALTRQGNSPFLALIVTVSPLVTVGVSSRGLMVTQDKASACVGSRSSSCRAWT